MMAMMGWASVMVTVATERAARLKAGVTPGSRVRMTDSVPSATASASGAIRTVAVA
jgi:hypothetical protein